jgi:hypothetical protein
MMRRKPTYLFSLAVSALMVTSTASAQNAGVAVNPLLTPTSSMTAAPANVEPVFTFGETLHGNAMRILVPGNNTMPRANVKTQRMANTSDFSMIGVCTESNGARQEGVYKISGDGTMTYVPGTASIKPTAGAWVIGDVYYAYNSIYVENSNQYSANILAYNMSDWSYVEDKSIIGLSSEMYASAVAYSAKDNAVYGCYKSAKNFYSVEMFKYDLSTKTRTVIATPERAWVSAFFDENNQLYVINLKGNLLKVDTQTGAETLVGATGTWSDLTGIAYDQLNNKAYWSVYDYGTAHLDEVNLMTGAATKVMDLSNGEHFCGLVMQSSSVDKRVPATVSNLAANFANGSLNGKVSFTMPTTTDNGVASTGSLTYKVMANGTQCAGGTSSYGAEVSVDVALEDDDEYVFSVVVTNENGDSAAATTTIYVGHDTPLAPTNVNLTWSDGSFHITWNAVTQGVHSGYVDASAITYTVTRYPGDVTVARDIKATKYDDVYSSDSSKCYYTVVATYDNRDSEEATTESVKGSDGIIIPPYSNDFNTSTKLEDFTIIDANGDDVTWIYRQAPGTDYKAVCCMMPGDDSTSASKDDWFITPPIAMEAGKMYMVSYDVWGSNGENYPEKYEMRMGTSNTVSGMTTTLMTTTTVDWSTPTTFYVKAQPTTTGNYYIGIHANSTTDGAYFYFDNLTISTSKDPASPGSVTNLKITPASGGVKSADISFTAPSKTINGGTLATLTKIEVSRDGEVVKTFDNPTIGGSCSFTDAVPTSGDHLYVVTPYNESGAGEPVSATAYVGKNVPSYPPFASASESKTNPGEVTITWQAPEADVDGNALTADELSYLICDITSSDTYTVIAEVTDGLSYTYQAVDSNGDQEVKQYGVIAKTEAGTGDGYQIDPIFLGPAYIPPYVEGFEGGQPTYVYAKYPVSGTTLVNSRVVDSDFKAYITTDANGDDGYLVCGGFNGSGASAIFATGKIDMNLTNPVFSFYTFPLYNSSSNLVDDNEVAILVSTDRCSTFEEVKRFYLDQDAPTPWEWKKLSVDLSDYKGQVVNIGIQFVSKNFAYTILDYFKLSDDIEYNASMGKISAPTEVGSDEEFEVSARLTNTGRQNLNSVTVNLYRNNQIVATKEVKNLASEENYLAKFTEKLTVASETENEYYIEAVTEKDDNLNDNKTSVAKVKVRKYLGPMVENLKGDGSELGYVNLTWDAPDLEDVDAAQEVDESFEGYSDWSTSVGDWTMYDGDQSKIGSLDGLTIPGISGALSFWVMNASNSLITGSGYAKSFAAHSGSKYLSNMFLNDGGQCDDWAISPVLTGESQKISFYAKSYEGSYPESFEVLYSTSDKNVASFSSLGRETSVPNDWTKYEYTLPAGTMYFAIRCYSQNCFMLFIDDVHFIQGVGDLTLLGYNVYREGVKVNKELITETKYACPEKVNGTHTYSVSAVYANGESNAASIQVATTKVVGVVAESANIYVENREIVVAGAEGARVAICTVDGKLVADKAGVDTMRFAVAEGVYIVKVGKRVVKVIVK